MREPAAPAGTAERRIDHRVIVEWVDEGSSVLDLGCGAGELLELLATEKSISGHGIELDDRLIHLAVARGVNVLHGDIESGLSEYSDDSFDFVILNQSLQQVWAFDSTFDNALRVGRRIIIGIPNFAHYRARLQLLAGRIPVTHSLPYRWYNSPNMHFTSIRDFTEYCAEKGARIDRSEGIGVRRRVPVLPNLFAEVGVFLISRRSSATGR